MKQSLHERNARTVTRYAKNIRAVYDVTDALTRVAGALWYKTERNRCADFGERYNLSSVRVAGAAAAISPGLRWETTFSHLAALLRDSSHPVPTYNREFVRRAARILNGEQPLDVLSGPKVTAFYLLLAGIDLNAVVIDGHALNIARGERVVFREREGYRAPAAARVTEARYRLAVLAYRRVAGDLDIPAHAVQATTWIHWRAVK